MANYTKRDQRRADLHESLAAFARGRLHVVKLEQLTCRYCKNPAKWGLNLGLAGTVLYCEEHLPKDALKPRSR